MRDLQLRLRVCCIQMAIAEEMQKGSLKSNLVGATFLVVPKTTVDGYNADVDSPGVLSSSIEDSGM